MKIVVSPAKSLDYKTPVPTQETTQAVFAEEAEQINALLRKQSPKALSKLMHISDQLAELNWERNQFFGTGVSKDTSRAAVFAFNGDVYQGLDPYTMGPNDIQQMQDRLRILSGLYGLLKPLDAIQPYRRFGRKRSNYFIVFGRLHRSACFGYSSRFEIIFKIFFTFVGTKF